jgi:hypothetical protein
MYVVLHMYITNKVTAPLPKKRGHQLWDWDFGGNDKPQFSNFIAEGGLNLRPQ